MGYYEEQAKVLQDFVKANSDTFGVTRVPAWLDRLPICPHCGERLYVDSAQGRQHIIVTQGATCTMLRYQRGCEVGK